MTEVRSRRQQRSCLSSWPARSKWQAVPDPEVPCVTVADLGILRSVDPRRERPAVVQADADLFRLPGGDCHRDGGRDRAAKRPGFDSKIERVISPAWTTDWITEEGREKLRAYGIAPPVGASGGRRASSATT
jgi:ring-1,2-phenylacetyl-CoA epoxidase subunit PaaD